MLRPKKVGTLPADDTAEETKRTNEITQVIPLLNTLAIEDKDITADALHTQRAFARYLVEERQAHYHFTVKANQPTLLNDLTFYFKDRQEPDFIDQSKGEHGRIETRKIWATTELNSYLDFPHAQQAFLIERQVINKKTGAISSEFAYGITSRRAEDMRPAKLLQINRGHWTIENRCHYVIDWNYDEDRGRIRTGHGPENVTRLRRFATSVIQAKHPGRIAQTIRRLSFSVRLVFDYLGMTENSCRAARPGNG